MRNASLVFAAALTMGASLSCGESIKRYRNPGLKTAYLVEVWVQDDPLLPKDVLLRGCRQWLAEGVECGLVDTEMLADIRVYVSQDPCVEVIVDPKTKKARTRTVLAWAHQGGKIEMMAKCLDHSSAGLEAHQLAAVMTHETGHQLGIWEHVPYGDECGAAKRHPNGKPVCGDAVMNPHYNPAIDFVTVVDALAFDLRDPVISVLVNSDPTPPSIGPNGPPDCVYYGN